MSDFLQCPKCKSRNWRDIPRPGELEKTVFVCVRCNHHVKFGSCKACGQSRWDLTRGIDPKGGRQPVYRMTCSGCGRVVGILMG